MTETPLTERTLQGRLATHDFPIDGTTTHNVATLSLRECSPYLATSLHHSQHIRSSLSKKMKLSDDERRYEEDVGMNRFLETFQLALASNISRFECDMNRAPAEALYRHPQQAWNLDLWREPLSKEDYEQTIEKWREFDRTLRFLWQHLLGEYGFGAIFDFHSYNYQRHGSFQNWREDEKPVINLGTHHVDREFFGPLIERLKEKLRCIKLEGIPLTVRENRLFFGADLAQRVTRASKGRIVVLPIELKKIYMDEQIGTIYENILSPLLKMIPAAIHELMQEMSTEYA